MFESLSRGHVSAYEKGDGLAAALARYDIQLGGNNGAVEFTLAHATGVLRVRWYMSCHVLNDETHLSPTAMAHTILA